VDIRTTDDGRAMRGTSQPLVARWLPPDPEPEPTQEPEPTPAEQALVKIDERLTMLERGMSAADLCGHADRPEYRAGYCDECWAIFAEQQGIQEQPDPAVWDKAALRLAEVWDDPKKHGVLTRRVKALKAKLALNLPAYADLHLKAAAVAAREGDAKPAQWALEHITDPEGGRVAQPAAKAVAEKSGGSGGVKVFIGVKVGGLPRQAIEATVVSAEDVPVLEDTEEDE